MSQDTDSAPQVPEHFVKGTAYAMQSLCTKCYAEGETKFLMTEIPFYKEVIVSSFRCDHCPFQDVQVTNAAELAPKAITFTLKVNPILSESEEVLLDLARTVVRTDSTRISIPELGFEIPPNRSEINTVEGIILNIRESLAYQQEERKISDPANYEKIQEICDKFESMQNGEEEFTLVLSDPAGHCFITNPYAPALDTRCTVTYTERTREQYIQLGYAPDEVAPILTEEEMARKDYKDKLLNKAISDIRKREAREQRKYGSSVMKLGGGPAKNTDDMTAEEKKKAEYKTGGSRGVKSMSSKLLNKKDLSSFESLSQQTLNSTTVFPQTCSACRRRGETRACVVDIPYFGEVIVMCTTCENCQYKNTDVKTSQAYAEKGVKITVKCDNIEDLSRDVLKGNDSAIEIPELGLALPSGVLGARFSSIEGLLTAIHEQISVTKANYLGDSAGGDEATKVRVLRLFREFDEVLAGERPFTFIIDDCAGHSFIEGRANGEHDTSPFEDEKMTIEYYTRSKEQDDMLGISDMVTENYYHPKKSEDSDDDEDDSDNDSDEDDESDESDDDAEIQAAFERLEQIELAAKTQAEEESEFAHLKNLVNHPTE